MMPKLSTLEEICGEKMVSMVTPHRMKDLTIETAHEVVQFVQTLPAALIKAIENKLGTMSPTYPFNENSFEHIYCMIRGFHQAAEFFHLPLADNFPYYHLLADHPEEGKGIEIVTVGTFSSYGRGNKVLQESDSVWMKTIAPLMKYAPRLDFKWEMDPAIHNNQVVAERIKDFFRSFSSLKSVKFESDKAILDLLAVGMREIEDFKEIKVVISRGDIEIPDILKALRENLTRVETLEIDTNYDLVLTRDMVNTFKAPNVKKLVLSKTDTIFDSIALLFVLDTAFETKRFFKNCTSAFPNLTELDLGNFRLEHFLGCLHRKVWPILTKVALGIRSKEFSTVVKTIETGMPKLQTLTLYCANVSDPQVFGEKQEDIDAIKCLKKLKVLGLAILRVNREFLGTLLKTLSNLEILHFKAKVIKDVTNVDQWLISWPDHLKAFILEADHYNSDEERVNLAFLEPMIKAKCHNIKTILFFEEITNDDLMMRPLDTQFESECNALMKH